MKRMTAFLFLAATLIAMGSVRAHAQSTGFKVPFDFTVGNQLFPAGTYQVSYPAQRVILIQSQDERFYAMSMIYAADPSTNDNDNKIVFTKYGNQYFLHEVLCSAMSMDVALPTSRLEKRARIQEAQLPHSETVAALLTGAK